eukprot:CAMPEP_0171293706 /NCGR_PEP_ID=MMETSP0816-20121228/2046_1 /TAXON_ID=420281 /ORGANISM="Proboscia inermis, Strain CCAP1064/1" /LENGTH=60 /DNA_ID=CAMNT_0011764869 /DNA_START=237 /DNA_END=416 /DNA_ORIENTATION=-
MITAAIMIDGAVPRKHRDAAATAQAEITTTNTPVASMDDDSAVTSINKRWHTYERNSGYW